MNSDVFSNSSTSTIGWRGGGCGWSVKPNALKRPSLELQLVGASGSFGLMEAPLDEVCRRPLLVQGIRHLRDLIRHWPASAAGYRNDRFVAGMLDGRRALTLRRGSCTHADIQRGRQPTEAGKGCAQFTARNTAM